MRLEQLYYLVEIAKNNSMSIAAENLHIAQSSLSLSIKQLEEELDTVIFSRSKKGSFLTEQGEGIFHKATQILNIVESLYPSKNISNTKTAEKINILSVATFNPIISKIIITILNKHIKVKQKTKILNAENINRIIYDLKNDYDFIFTTMSSDSLNIHLNQLLQYYHVYIVNESNLSIMTSRNSSYASFKHISFAQLKKMSFAQYSNDEDMKDFFCSLVEKHYNITLNKAITTNDINSVSAYIENGTICSIMTPFVQVGTHYRLSTENVLLIPLKDKIKVSFVLLRPKNKNFNTTQQLFFDMLQEYYPTMKELK